MRTHFLNFKVDGKEVKLLTTEKFFNGFMNIWLSNPSYVEKLDCMVDMREQHSMVCTMAEFRGVGGKTPKKIEIKYHLVAPDEKTLDERKKILAKFKERWKNKSWADPKNLLMAKAAEERRKQDRIEEIKRKVRQEDLNNQK